MARDQSALLELLGELRLTEVSDRIRVATETLYQELADAEAAAFIGAAAYQRTEAGTTQRDITERPAPHACTLAVAQCRDPAETGSQRLQGRAGGVWREGGGERGVGA